MSWFQLQPTSVPPAEFQRLLKAIGRQTGKKYLSIREQFDACYGNMDCWAFYGRVSMPTTLSGGSDKSHERPSDKKRRKPVAAAAATENRQFDLSNPPLVKFFRKYERKLSTENRSGNRSGYLYSGGNPINEFRSLSECVLEKLDFRTAARQWIATMPISGKSVLAPDFQFTFWKSEIYRELQDQFYQAIEEQFDWFADIQCSKRGIKKHEYLVLFFELGSQTGVGGKQLDEEGAYKVR